MPATNRIAVIRRKAKLSKRALAAKLATSPEQIERYESGQTISPELANVIATTLETPIEQVFPGLANNPPTTDEEWLKLGFEPGASVPSWLLTLSLRSLPSPRYYQIDEDDLNHIASLFNNLRARDFLTFDSGARSIYVSVAEVQYAYLRNDSPTAFVLPTTDWLRPEHASVRIFFSGRSEPVVFPASDFERRHLDTAFTPLHCSADTADEFLTLPATDFLMPLRRAEIALVEVPSAELVEETELLGGAFSGASHHNSPDRKLHR